MWQTKNPNRCDQCFKGHRACDRLMPKCSRCTKVFSDCTYVRKAIAKKNLHYIEDKISMFKVKNETKTTNSSSLFLRHEPQIVLLPKNFNLVYTPIYTFTKFPFKYVLQNTMTCLQCINPFVSNCDVSTMIPLFDFFGILPTKKKRFQLSVIIREIKDLNSILSQAYENYFQYNNYIFPIFIKSDFNFNSKSLLLRMCILLAGLNHMERNEKTSYLFDLFHSRIHGQLKYPHRIPITLQSLQAVLIFLNGFYSCPWILDKRNIYIIYCEKTALALGLHKSINKLEEIQNIERVMTYSSLVAFTMFTRIMYGSYMSQPYQPQYLDKIFKTIMLDLLNESNTQLLHNKDVTFYWNLILTSFYNELGYVLFLTRLLKEKYMNPSKLNEIPTNSNLDLISKAKKLQKKYITLLVLLKLKFDNKDNSFSILDCQSHILYIISYIVHYLNSLEYFNPAKKSKLDNNNTSDSAIDYLNITLMGCYLTIYYGIKLPFYKMFDLGLDMICCSLYFVLRYKHRSKINFNLIFDKGINYIKEISKLTMFTHTANMHVTILSFPPG